MIVALPHLEIVTERKRAKSHFMILLHNLVIEDICKWQTVVNERQP